MLFYCYIHKSFYRLKLRICHGQFGDSQRQTANKSPYTTFRVSFECWQMKQLILGIYYNQVRCIRQVGMKKSNDKTYNTGLVELLRVG